MARQRCLEGKNEKTLGRNDARRKRKIQSGMEEPLRRTVEYGPNTRSHTRCDSGLAAAVPHKPTAMEILVFRTNLTNTDHIGKLTPSLNHHPGILEWNVDLNDRDNILRIVSSTISPSEAEQLVFQAGYFCRELE